MLRALPREAVLQRRWPSAAMPADYFRIMDPQLPLMVARCGHCYEQDEYQMARRHPGPAYHLNL